jgi:hypothetical protein
MAFSIGAIMKTIVRISAGSVHKAMNNFGFFTTFGHLFFILGCPTDYFAGQRILWLSESRKAAAYIVQQLFQECYCSIPNMCY